MLLGLMCRAGQAIGLHVDGKRWNLAPELETDRRNLFWECFSYDAQISMMFGRPPCILTPPADRQRISQSESSEFYSFKHQLAETSASMAGDALINCNQTYERVLQLDQRLRDLDKSIPPRLRVEGAMKIEVSPGKPWAANHQILQAFLLSSLLHKNLLFLHRPWLDLLLRQDLPEPADSAFGLSFKTCIQSAHAIAQSMQSLMLYCPHEASLEFTFASHAISAAAVLTACITKAPKSRLVLGVWQDLRLLIDALSSTPANAVTKASSQLLQRFSEASRQAIGGLRTDQRKRKAMSSDDNHALDLHHPTRLANGSTQSGNSHNLGNKDSDGEDSRSRFSQSFSDSQPAPAFTDPPSLDTSSADTPGNPGDSSLPAITALTANPFDVFDFDPSAFPELIQIPFSFDSLLPSSELEHFLPSDMADTFDFNWPPFEKGLDVIQSSGVV